MATELLWQEAYTAHATAADGRTVRCLQRHGGSLLDAGGLA